MARENYRRDINFVKFDNMMPIANIIFRMFRFFLDCVHKVVTTKRYDKNVSKIEHVLADKLI